MSRGAGLGSSSSTSSEGSHNKKDVFPWQPPEESPDIWEVFHGRWKQSKAGSTVSTQSLLQIA